MSAIAGPAADGENSWLRASFASRKGPRRSARMAIASAASVLRVSPVLLPPLLVVRNGVEAVREWMRHASRNSAPRRSPKREPAGDGQRVTGGRFAPCVAAVIIPQVYRLTFPIRIPWCNVRLKEGVPLFPRDAEMGRTQKKWRVPARRNRNPPSLAARKGHKFLSGDPQP